MALKGLSELRTAVRQLSNTENSRFVSDQEINDRIGEGVGALYDLIVGAYEGYYVTSTTFTLANGVNSVLLPGDFYKAIGLDRQITPTRNETVLPIPSWTERNNVGRRGYSLSGNGLTVFHPQSAAGTYTLYYVPLCGSLSPVSGQGMVLDALGDYANLTFPLSVDPDDLIGETITISGAAHSDNNGVFTVLTAVDNTPRSAMLLGLSRTSGSFISETLPPACSLLYPVILDAIMSNWATFVQLHAAIAILDKREMDSASLQQRLFREQKRIEAAAADRDDEPWQMPLVRRHNPWSL